MKTQFIVEIDGVAQTEMNYAVRHEAVMKIQTFPEFLVMRAKVVEYVRKE